MSSDWTTISEMVTTLCPMDLHGINYPACSAEYLSVHPYFNPNVHPEDTSPTIELISPQIYPVGANNVSIKLKVSDAQGLHQVILSTTTPLSFTIALYAAAGFAEVKACQGLAGKRILLWSLTTTALYRLRT